MLSSRPAPGNHGANAGPEQLNFHSTPRRPAAAPALQTPSDLRAALGVEGHGTQIRETTAETFLDCSIPDPSTMSLAALCVRGWHYESETWSSIVASDDSRSGSGLDPFAEDTHAAALNPSEGEGRREPPKQRASNRLPARLRLIGSLQEVLLILDDDNDGDVYDEGDEIDSMPAAVLASQ